VGDIGSDRKIDKSTAADLAAYPFGL